MTDLVFDKSIIKVLFVKEVPGDSKPQSDKGLFFCVTGNRTPWYGCAVLGLVHTSDGIGSGVGSARSVTIQCKTKRGIVSGVGSSTESK